MVMPFDDFAAMVGISSPVAGKPRVTRAVTSPAPTSIPIRHEDRDEIAEALAELDINHFQEEEASVPSSPRGETTPQALKDEGFLEEKFYLEPLDDEESLK